MPELLSKASGPATPEVELQLELACLPREFLRVSVCRVPLPVSDRKRYESPQLPLDLSGYPAKAAPFPNAVFRTKFPLPPPENAPQTEPPIR